MKYAKLLINSNDTGWNGRRIRNECQTALALAEFEAQGGNYRMPTVHSTPVILAARHFEKVGNAYDDFERYIYHVKGLYTTEQASRDQIRDDTYKSRKLRRRIVMSDDDTETDTISISSASSSSSKTSSGSEYKEDEGKPESGSQMPADEDHDVLRNQRTPGQSKISRIPRLQRLPRTLDRPSVRFLDQAPSSDPQPAIRQNTPSPK